MKNSQFLNILKENLRFCEKVLNILSKFKRIFKEKFRKFEKYAFVGGSGGGAPRS